MVQSILENELFLRFSADQTDHTHKEANYKRKESNIGKQTPFKIKRSDQQLLFFDQFMQ